MNKPRIAAAESAGGVTGIGADGFRFYICTNQKPPEMGGFFAGMNGDAPRPSDGETAGSVGADVIVCFYDTAVIKSAVWSGGADEDVGLGEVNFERRAPRIHVFALFVQLILATDEDNDVFSIFA